MPTNTMATIVDTKRQAMQALHASSANRAVSVLVSAIEFWMCEREMCVCARVLAVGEERTDTRSALEPACVTSGIGRWAILWMSDTRPCGLGLAGEAVLGTQRLVPCSRSVGHLVVLAVALVLSIVSINRHDFYRSITQTRLASIN